MFAKTELVGLLASEDAGAKTEARRRLGVTEEDELLPFLTDCLTKYNKSLRSAAARVLTLMGDESVLLHIVDALEDRDSRVRNEAGKAILAFDDPRPLIRHIQSYILERNEDE